MSDFADCKIVTARKEHICELCGLVIDKGTKYARQSGMFDGDFYRQSLHLHCNNLINDYAGVYGCYEYDFDDVRDFATQRVCDYCDKCEDCDEIAIRCPFVIEKYTNTGERNCQECPVKNCNGRCVQEKIRHEVETWREQE